MKSRISSSVADETKIAPPGVHRLPSLDGLRAVSVGMVMLGHASHTFVPWPAFRTMLVIVGNGSLGVAVFFVISGFLITHLLLTEAERKGRVHLGDFYLRRAFRILPPAYAYIGVVAILWATGRMALDRSDLLTAATFTWNYHHSDHGWFLGHLWSLSVEEQFYLIWPALLTLVGFHRAIWFAVSIIVVSPLVRVVMYITLPAWRDHIPMMVHTRADTLMFGCLAALVWRTSRGKAFLDRWCTGWAVALATTFLFLIAPQFQARFRGEYQNTIGYTIEAAALTLIMLTLVRESHRPWARPLNWQWVGFIGVLSYGLYLWQQLLITNLNTTWTGKFPVSFATCAAIAIAAHWIIERPFARLRSVFRPTC